MLATDLSDTANHAFFYAVRLARQLHAPLLIVHVFQPPTSWQTPGTDSPKQMSSLVAEASNKRLKEQYAKHATGIPVQYLSVEHVSAAKGILDVVEDQLPDLLVVGAIGWRKADEIRLESTTRALLVKAPIPVLTVPAEAVVGDCAKVLFATDFQEQDLTALEQLADLVEPFHPELFIVHVQTGRDDGNATHMQQIKEAMHHPAAFSKVHWEVLLADDIAGRLQEFIRQQQIDLLVMVEKKREGLLDRLFQKDHVKAMERQSMVPLMSYNIHCFQSVEP